MASFKMLADVAQVVAHTQPAYNIHASGRRFTEAGLCAMFEAVLSNPHIEVASLHEAISHRYRGSVDQAIRTFADCLPGSSLIAANLGEYCAHPDTWQHLIDQLPHSILGHLYVSEPLLSLLSEEQKRAARRCLRQNRQKTSYIWRILMPGRIKQVAACRPWWAAPDTAEWYNTQLPKLD